ncbi:DUF3634 family protein [Vibrio gallicus]|uniref:DUF3634 family protein n=1 Tax=Vibrio gallicus TaxID=190897 RepID=UPI0021C29C8F|nr:DUF3634 family protein [Vibrio gallicus]
MLYVIVIAAILIFGIILYDKPLASYVFKQGNLTKSQGAVDKQFVLKSKEIARKQPFSGTVKVYKTRKQYKVKFSKSIPNKVRHALREQLPGSKAHTKKR